MEMVKERKREREARREERRGGGAPLGEKTIQPLGPFALQLGRPTSLRDILNNL